MAKQPKVAEAASGANPEASHRAKDPEIIARSQKLFEVLGGIGKYLAIGFVTVAVIYFWYKNSETKDAQKAKEVAQVDRDDTGWVQDPKEPLSEVRQIVVYPDQPKVVIISDQYRFDAKCKGEAEINIYGRKKPIPCNPKPGTDHLGDSLRSVSGFYTLEFVTKTPVQVIVRRLPK